MLKVKVKIPEPIIFYTRYGLSNRLLGLTCVMRWCDMFQRPLQVAWPTSWDIGRAPFGKLFQNNIKIVRKTKGLPWLKVSTPRKRKMLRRGHLIVANLHQEVCLEGESKSQIDLSPYFAQLKPVAIVQDKLDYMLDKHDDMRNVIGFHIRKGDKQRSFADPQVMRRMEKRYFIAATKLLKKHPEKRIFLCTDDKTVEKKYQEAFGDGIIVCSKESPADKRQSYKSIHEAMIDLYLLSHTEVIVFGLGTFGYGASWIHNRPRTNVMFGDNQDILFARRVHKRGKWISADRLIAQVVKLADTQG